MPQGHCNEENINDMLSFVFQPPCGCGQENCDCDEQIYAMDCNESCDQLAQLAERVAAGEKLEDLLPRFGEHIRSWKDCREEFEALVAVLKAERSGELDAALEQIWREINPDKTGDLSTDVQTMGQE